jgi:hypothetical protein
MRQQFEDGLNEFKADCDARVQQLKEALELRRKVDIHEVEERKNQHINELVANHQTAFNQMKSYYNDITTSNLQLIRSLQQQIENLKAKAASNKQRLLDYTQENMKLSAPLQKVSADVAEIRANLRERAKDQLALKNTRARLAAMQHAVETLKKEYVLLQRLYEVRREVVSHA